MNVIHDHIIHICAFRESTRMVTITTNPMMSHPNNPAICPMLSILDSMNP
jgi:hypothetical protein